MSQYLKDNRRSSWLVGALLEMKDHVSTIDLHLHTTSSDGRCTPEDLVQRAWAAGIRTLSVTDHDTMSGVGPAVAAATPLGIEVIPGIELTSVHEGKDVHVLAYFLQESTPGLAELLERQRRLRRERALEIARRLAAHGAPLDVARLIDAAGASGQSVARPQLAQALVAGGFVQTVAEAFDRFLGEDKPAYVPHEGASPQDVVAFVSARGGVASLAHPGYRPRDEIIPCLVDAGLSALEVYHSAHDRPTQHHYLEMARRYALLVTGGSDYHGEGTRRAEFFGVISLPREDLDALLAHRSARSSTALAAIGRQ